MSLLITIIKAPDSVAIVESSKTFDNNGGSIGRGKDNAWVIDDPERFLSSNHCQFSCEDNQFYITDLSTNGTFYKGSPEPIGKGSKLPVNDGDTFALGDYVFSISVSDSVSLADPFGGSMESLSAAESAAEDIFANSNSNNSDFAEDGFIADPFADVHGPGSESLFSSRSEETDPLAALDKAQASGENNMNPAIGVAGGFDSNADPFASPSYSDQSDALNQQLSWPDAVPDVISEQASNSSSGSGIPDDWDEDLSSAPSQAVSPAVEPAVAVPPSMPLTEPPVVPEPGQSTAAKTAGKQAGTQDSGQPGTTESEVLAIENQTLQKANAILQAELNILKQQLKAQQQRAVKTEITVDTSIVDAMGFQKHQLVDAQITQINELAGEVFREMVSGLMQVLGSRSAIKNEFRMNVTTIQPVENNPLKFSANVDDALENMFIKEGNAYKKPLEAVREGFDGIAEHQVAILAGIRSAFKGVIERFDPAILDAKFSRQNKSNLIPGSHKAKNWDLYLEYYNELVGDIDNTFQFLFGDDFVRAYEDQLQRLAIARKSKNSKGLK
ncbi:MAG: type VI secretion system-associated FHA domain protein TagH [Gammaproteobacteria bacterium]|nr:MAG: type VI secretion system-associated FHA domain protein TagH [Gammaproteobacteria bacterium]